MQRERLLRGERLLDAYKPNHDAPTCHLAYGEHHLIPRVAPPLLRLTRKLAHHANLPRLRIRSREVRVLQRLGRFARRPSLLLLQRQGKRLGSTAIEALSLV